MNIVLASRPAGRMNVEGPIKVESLGGFLRVDGKQFRDALYVYSFNGDCIVVNHVDLEKYVIGLLHSEMNANWNTETLKAQAVAARSYAVFQMKVAGNTKFRNFKPPFDLDSSVKDQVYEGAHKERYKAMRAVEATKGQVLQTFAGEPVKAFYHSTCGGHTECPERVWGAKYAYMKPVPCGYCNSSPRFNWNYEVAESVLVEKLAKAKALLGKFVSLKLVKRNPAGRAEKIEVRGSEGAKVLTTAKLREIIGTSNLMSTDFILAAGTAGKMIFAGHGSGHGVGMCQWGAKVMGEKNFTYAQILKRYYPQTQISKIY